MQDPSAYFLLVNFLVGVALMLASGPASEFVAIPFSQRPQEAARAARIAHVAVLIFGAATATLMVAIYLLSHLLRIST